MTQYWIYNQRIARQVGVNANHTLQKGFTAEPQRSPRPQRKNVYVAISIFDFLAISAISAALRLDFFQYDRTIPQAGNHSPAGIDVPGSPESFCSGRLL